MLKRLVATVVALTVLVTSSLTAFADYGRYEVKDYPWYGKYSSYAQGHKINVGSERQYSDMKAISDQWKTVKTLHKELQNKVFANYAEPKLQRVGMISVLDRLSDKVNAYYGVTNNNWDTKAGMQATVDGLTSFRMGEDESFIKSVYAEYAMNLNLMYMSAVMSENAATYTKGIKKSWESVNYYYLIMDKLVSNMKFTTKGFTYNGTVSADIKTLIGQNIGQVAETTTHAIKSDNEARGLDAPEIDPSTLTGYKRIHYDGLETPPDYVTEEGYGYTGKWWYFDLNNGATVEQIVGQMGYAKYNYSNKLVYVVELAAGVTQYIYFILDDNGRAKAIEYSFPTASDY